MKFFFTAFFTSCLLICFAQDSNWKRYKVDPNNPPIVCFGHGENHGHVVPPPAQSRHQPKNPAEFIPDYDDDVPEVALKAFDYAFGLLSAELSSTIPIRVRVNWQTEEELSPGALAAASPAEYVVNFTNSTERIAYPISLAEKLAGVPINSDNEPDIRIWVNRDQFWYYDFDNPEGIQSRQFDFVTILLHAL